MKNVKLIIAMLVLMTVSAKSQVVTKDRVIFCDYATDTLAKEQFKNCDKFRVLTDKDMEIVSYTLVYRNGSDIFEYNGTGNSLPERIIKQIIDENVAAFWLEHITVIKENNKIDLGARKFLLKG